MLSLPNSKILRLSKPSEQDLHNIAAYTSRNWGNTQKKIYINKIMNDLEILCQMPSLGYARDELSSGLRAYMIEQHIVYYRESKTQIIVIRILHEKMDSEQHLSQLK
ncbi:MAG: hypothetical protein AUK35_07490 [Zetaproteobacteria bacterium CG2_30_46_52]|nr:MAG: hypothetical protein AUK35_07490 [Zetaproteobacteria bacterium CG2_30_46_52]